jgi:hypothetical protein
MAPLRAQMEQLHLTPRVISSDSKEKLMAPQWQLPVYFLVIVISSDILWLMPS